VTSEGATPRDVHDAVADAVGRVLVGNDDLVRGLTVALLTGGHVLVQGVPGVGKTTAARLFARATGLDYGRIQMTPDVLPADVTGTHVYRQETGEFELQTGPVFANVVVADEINRATPKTQSALLEAMQEGTVTIEGDTRALPDPFLVVATQNPVETQGTFALPEAQRDRFLFELRVEIPDRERELAMLDRFDAAPDLGPDDIDAAVARADLLAARDVVGAVHVARPAKEYVLDLVAATRDDPALEHGASPRAALALLRAAKGAAALAGRDYVIPDDVKGFALQTLAHRVVLGTDAELSDRAPREIVGRIVDETAPPGAEATFDPADGSTDADVATD